MKYTLSLMLLVIAMSLSACFTFTPPPAQLQIGKTVSASFVAPEIDPATAMATGTSITVNTGSAVRFASSCVDQVIQGTGSERTKYIIRRHSLIEVNKGGTWTLIEVPQPVIVH